MLLSLKSDKSPYFHSQLNMEWAPDDFTQLPDGDDLFKISARQKIQRIERNEQRFMEYEADMVMLSYEY